MLDSTGGLTSIDTLPRPRASQEPIGHHQVINLDGLGSVRRSSCLRFQMFGVETSSFFPNEQRDGRNLARQGEASHLRLHPFGEQCLVKILQRSGTTAGAQWPHS